MTKADLLKKIEAMPDHAHVCIGLSYTTLERIIAVKDPNEFKWYTPLVECSTYKKGENSWDAMIVIVTGELEN